MARISLMGRIQKLTYFILGAVLTGLIPMNSIQAEPKSDQPESTGYIAISFYPVAGEQIPAVVHSLGNDYAYYNDRESEEMRKVDAGILKKCPLEILFDGQVIEVLEFNVSGTGNSLGGMLYQLQAAEGEHSLQFKIEAEFEPIRINFMGEKVEVRPIVINDSQNSIQLEVISGEVIHVRVEDFAVDIKKIRQAAAEDGYIVFGMICRMNFIRDESTYSDLVTLSHKLNQIRQASPLKRQILN